MDRKPAAGGLNGGGEGNTLACMFPLGDEQQHSALTVSEQQRPDYRLNRVRT